MTRTLRLAAIATIALILALPAFGGGSGEAAGKKQVLRVSMAGSADALDPHVTGARRAYTIMMNIFDTLVYRDVDGSYKPGLALEWSNTADGKQYTFRLRQGVKFHDGTPFNAAAVVYNLDRIKNPKLQSKFATNALGPYASSRAIDDTTVEVKFSDPIAPSVLLDSLSQAYLGMVSPAAAEKHGLENFGRNPVGSGPYVFKEWTAQNRVTLVKNPDYSWASPVFKHQGPGYLDELVFMTVVEDSTRAATLETAESDVALELGEEAITVLEKNSKFQLVKGAVPGCPIILWMNVEHPILSDIRVRKAILHAFDPAVLAEKIYQGRVVPAYGPLAPVTWAYNPAVEKMYPYDLKKAAAYLDEAGWKLNPSTGIREKAGRKLAFDVNDITERRRIEFFQAQMKQIGIEVDARAVTSDVLFQITREANTYSMASTWWAYSDPDVLRILYHSSNVGTGFAISRYKDPELDRMLVQALGELNTERRKQRYFDIQTFIMDKALTVPVYMRMVHDGLRGDITGYRVDRGQYPVLFDVRYQ